MRSSVPRTRPKTAFQDIKEGFRFVRSRVWLWGTFLAATLAYLIFWGPSEVLLPFIVKNHMHGSASDLGFILALGGVGAMFAAMVMGNREMPRRHITFMYGVWTLSTLAVAGYGLASFPWQAMVASFVFNALEGAGTIVWATTKGRLVPERLLGRVSSFDWFISIGLVPLSFAITGPVAASSAPARPSSAPACWGHRHPRVPLPPRDARRRATGDLARASAEDDELSLGSLADDPMVPLGAGRPRRGGPEPPRLGS